MSVRKSGDFMADVERQFEWYAVNAGWPVAEGDLRNCDLCARWGLLLSALSVVGEEWNHE